MKQVHIINAICCIFPYLSISSGGYNQIYYLVTNLFVFALCFKGRFPIRMLPLLCLLILGVVLALVTVVDGKFLDQSTIKILVSFFFPFIIAYNFYHFLNFFPETAEKVIRYGILVWLSVAGVQFFIPSFGASLVVDSERILLVSQSGRGALSLAPEPTHFVLHVLCLISIYMFLTGFVSKAFFLAIITLFLGKSATAVFFIIAVSALLFLSLSLKSIVKLSTAALFVCFAYFILNYNLDIRLFYALNLYSSAGISGLLTDHSANMRYFGMLAGFTMFLSNYGLPQLLSSEVWQMQSSYLFQIFPLAKEFSPHGPSSGVGQIFYFGGLPGAMTITWLFASMFTYLRSYKTERFVFGICFLFFINQFTFASSVFGMLIGAAIVRADIRLNFPQDRSN